MADSPVSPQLIDGGLLEVAVKGSPYSSAGRNDRSEPKIEAGRPDIGLVTTDAFTGEDKVSVA